MLISVDGADHFAVEFRRRPHPSGLIYVTAVTGNFLAWSSGCEYSGDGAALPTAWTSDASDATWTRVRLNTPLGGEPHRFISVSVRPE